MCDTDEPLSQSKLCTVKPCDHRRLIKLQRGWAGFSSISLHYTDPLGNTHTIFISPKIF